jgi:hypothetical protein
VSEREADEMNELAVRIRNLVRQWLQAHHSHMLMK